MSVNFSRKLIWPMMLVMTSGAWADEVRVPAFTAYIQPNSRGARVSEERGITRWNDPKQSINWYGQFKQGGELKARVELKLEPKDTTRLKLTINDQSKEVTVSAAAANETTLADFGMFNIGQPGHQRIELTALDASGEPLAEVKSLVLEGAATQEVHFNLKERRNAASVHLMYPVPKNLSVEAFACDVTAVEDPTATFYMACGWHRGYFGMQVNSLQERRIIFSVWDSGNEGISRDKVADENRVQLVRKGEGVFTGDFGNEGTGGHSHLKTMWKTNEKQRFIVTAQPVDKTFTIYSGYWYRNADQRWMLISSWKAPKEGGWLRGLHSFSENFGGDTGHLQRKALYANQWIRLSDGKWLELTDAKFSHDATGRTDRFDRTMGIENGQFFLRHGGFLDGSTKYGELFTRPATSGPPTDIELP
ncbi:MAG: DUF3472 domain-containing protein [Pirellulaceae bacterium]|nr:DUF3472 domain-containing protein [Pirellulaceae bacterium]